MTCVTCLNKRQKIGRNEPNYPGAFDRITRAEWTEFSGRLGPKRASLPRTPNYFKGIINLRGQVISILDLRVKLELSKIKNGPKTSIIILDLEQDLSIGVIVDRINSVLAFSKEDIGPAPSEKSGVAEQFLTGVAKSEHAMTLLLNIRAALSLEDLSLVKKAQAHQARSA